MPVWLSSNKKTRSHPISLVDYQLALSSHFTNLSIIDKKSHKTSLLQTLQPTFFCSPFFSGGQKKCGENSLSPPTSLVTFLFSAMVVSLLDFHINPSAADSHSLKPKGRSVHGKQRGDKLQPFIREMVG